jgi:L-ascorbate metabolism protein UlaG (beta-lactamase superfamily)
MKTNDVVIYIDPYNIGNIDNPTLEAADYLIITHNHAPHFSPADMAKVSDNQTITIVSLGVSRLTSAEEYTVVPGQSLEFEKITFEFVPMYNIDKFNTNGDLFHDPASRNIGVIIDTGESRLYLAGDTDRIPEMKEVQADIAILPVSGYAWMTAEEAASAIDDIKKSSDLKFAIPTHYGNGNGGLWDAEKFAELANCNVVILDKTF